MSATPTMPVPVVVDDQVPVRPQARPTSSDRIFRAIATSAAFTSLAIVTVTLVFLFRQGWPAIQSSGIWGFFTDSVWVPTAGRFGVLGLLIGTLLIASIALLVAVPLAVGLALFINEYAPYRIGRLLTSVIDLLAALPSILFGAWGAYALQSSIVPIAQWFGDHLSAVPIFRLNESPQLYSSSFHAGIVVGIMIIPIIASVSRDVMAQVPREQAEGALALGGTRWGMITDIVLPYGRSGIIGATLLGFGRALGETIAVALIVSLSIEANWKVLESGGGSVASAIAIKFSEAGDIERGGLVAAGLSLFLVTLAVSALSRWIVRRGVKVR